jgi:hypothetical protein
VRTPRWAIAAASAALLLLALPAAARAAAGALVGTSPLASNGFESPSCTTPALAAQLSAGEQTNCSVSGVAIAPVPLSNYAIDINIPSGLGASGGEDVDSIVQDLLLTPVWTALVWLVHVVLVALEWCYSLDLLGPATLSRAGSALGAAKRVFTDPWLGLVLALAAVAFAWQGIVRRQVTDALGRAALLALMVTAGLWIIANPVGTVGAVGNLADEAALGTVAATATGNPSQPVASVDAAFGAVFDDVITGPWCYLEFGDVRWCRDPTLLDPHLRAVADQLEELYRAGARCRGPAPGLVQCAPAGSTLQSQLAGTATALGEARTNGALFLALPAGTIGRTGLESPTATPTLYQVLCRSGDPTVCAAPTALQAEFRTATGTWPRVGGLVLIAAGALGMMLLFGFIALRLLGAALATLIYLLLAPVAVLAPALGDSGRDTFRLWLTRLVGSVVAKLVYSVALGVLLLVMSLLGSLEELGWWTQWLLVSVFWWTAFEHRHRMLSLVLHERGELSRRAPLSTRMRIAGRSAGAGIGALRATGRLAFAGAVGAVAIAGRRRSFPREDGGGGGAQPGGAREPRGQARARARAELRAQAGRVAVVERGAPSGSFRTRMGVADGIVPPEAVPELTARAARLDSALAAARAAGDRRRVVSLEGRRARVAAELARRHGPHFAGSRLGLATRSALAQVVPDELRQAVAARTRSRALNRAARAAESAPARLPGPAAHLAALAGISSAEYLRSPPAQQRAARATIERELRRRRELLERAQPLPLRLLRAALGPDRRGAEAASAEETLARRRRQFGGRRA